eukprot:4171224-Pyramimonas_sp.AAC.1
MKFASDVGASAAINVIRDKANTENSGKASKGKIWCDLEAPIEVRVALGFLRNLRSQLIEWRFAKECAPIDRDARAMQAGGKEV